MTLNMMEDRRGDERRSLIADAEMAVDGAVHPCMIRNVAAGGLALSSQTRPTDGAGVTLTVSGMGEIPATVVRQTDDGIAVAFDLDPESCRRLVDSFVLALNPPLNF